MFSKIVTQTGQQVPHPRCSNTGERLTTCKCDDCKKIEF